MEDAKVLIYDGSFNGFLTALFVAFNENLAVTDFQKSNTPQNELFVESKIIETQHSKAKKVWEQLEKKGNTTIRNIYFAFLSETNGIEFMLFKYIQQLFKAAPCSENEQLLTIAQKIMQLANLVGKEKQLMETHVEFNSNDDHIYVTEIEPGYNVLPLISRYFRLKYSKHQWIIFDRKRNYGLYYNMKSVQIIDLETQLRYVNSNALANPFAQNEYRFAV